MIGLDVLVQLVGEARLLGRLRMIGFDVLVRLVGEARLLDRLRMIGLDVLMQLVGAARLLDRLLNRFEMLPAIAAGAVRLIVSAGPAIAAGAGPVDYLGSTIGAVAGDRWRRAIAAAAGDWRRRAIAAGASDRRGRAIVAVAGDRRVGAVGGGTGVGGTYGGRMSTTLARRRGSDNARRKPACWRRMSQECSRP